MKLIKRLFTNRKCLTGIPGICFYIKRVIKLLLLIKSLTTLSISSCEKTVSCQDKLPVMFWDVLRATDDACSLVYPSPVTRQQAFLLQTQHEHYLASHAGHCFQMQHLAFSSSFFKTSADVFLITEHYIQARLKSIFILEWLASQERS